MIKQTCTDADEILRGKIAIIRLAIYQRQYDSARKWREAWSRLANNIEIRRKKYPMQHQQEYIELRAQLANKRIEKLMRDYVY